MEKPLFSVSCTTCRARLAVRNKEAIGEILECPKCGSMVLIAPPEGWVFSEEPPPPPDKDLPAQPGSRPEGTWQGAGSTEQERRGDTETRGHGGGEIPASSRPRVPTSSPVPAPCSPPPILLPITAAGVSAPHAATPVASPSVAETPAPIPASAAPAAPAVAPPTFTPFELPEVVAGETFLTSLTRSLWGRVAVLAVSGLVGAACVLTAWTVISNRRHVADQNPTIRSSIPLSPIPRDPTPTPSRPCLSRSSIADGCPSRRCC